MTTQERKTHLRHLARVELSVCDCANYDSVDELTEETMSAIEAREELTPEESDLISECVADFWFEQGGDDDREGEDDEDDE